MKRQEIGCPDSLKKRYAFKLSANLVGFFISLITSVLIPRGLGPKAFGDFNFLTSFFNQVMGFFSMGTSLAYYTKLSQRPRDTDLVRFYLMFAIIISLVTMLCVFLIHWRAMDTVVWPGQEALMIYLAAGLGIIAWSNGILNQMADAYGLTVSMEKLRVGQKIIGLFLIIALFFGHLLQLTNYFFYNYLMTLLLSGACITIITRDDFFSLGKNWLLPWYKILSYLKEFYAYCHPLFILSLVGFIANIFDRWLLQFFGGSVQQGFYGLSDQIGALCFLFTGAMAPLLMREFSIAYQHHDLEKMANLFRRYVPLLYSIAAFIACFIAIQADKVIYITGGKAYKDALLAVTIMSFYPLLQTYGQLSGSVFYATGQTSLYRNIGVSFMIVGLPITYFLIAPPELYGLQAGSAGLAVKTVIIAFMGINVQLYFNARFLKLHFRKLFLHQLYTVVLFLLVSWFALVCTERINNLVLSFLVSAVMYSLGCIGLVILYPSIISMSRYELRTEMGRLLSMFWKTS